MLVLESKKLVKQKVKQMKKDIEDMNYQPRMVIFQVGSEAASNKYINFKLKKAEELGINAVHKQVDIRYSQEKLIEDIKEISPWVDGIIVQLPLPKSWDKQKVLDAIPFTHDIDGLAQGNNLMKPATPKGIISLLNFYEISWKDKVVCVVGQSNLVGKPVADMMEEDAKEVIRLNSKTGLDRTIEADILIVAAGKKDLIKGENIKQDAIVIDVGINELTNGSITGDVDRTSIEDKVKAISPVIGGVGPMTVISLFENLISTCKKKN